MGKKTQDLLQARTKLELNTLWSLRPIYMNHNKLQLKHRVFNIKLEGLHIEICWFKHRWVMLSQILKNIDFFKVPQTISQKIQILASLASKFIKPTSPACGHNAVAHWCINSYRRKVVTAFFGGEVTLFAFAWTICNRSDRKTADVQK